MFLWSVYSDANAPTRHDNHLPLQPQRDRQTDRNELVSTPRAEKRHPKPLEGERRGKAPVQSENSAGRRESFARRGRVDRALARESFPQLFRGFSRIFLYSRCHRGLYGDHGIGKHLNLRGITSRIMISNMNCFVVVLLFYAFVERACEVMREYLYFLMVFCFGVLFGFSYRCRSVAVRIEFRACDP